MIVKTIKNLHSLAETHDKVSNAKICAGLVYKNRLVATGFNSYKTHPKAWEYRRNDMSFYLHAEVDCLIRASKLLDSKAFRKSTLVVVRCRKGSIGEPWSYGLARPCSGCQKCIQAFNVGKVVYTLNSDLACLSYQTDLYT